MKLVLLFVLLLAGCAPPEKVECKSIETDGMLCKVCSHYISSGWYTSTPECHWSRAAPQKAS